MLNKSPDTSVIDNQTDRGALWLWAAALVAMAVWFITLGSRHLLNPDEGRYAEIAREMLVSGDWITPRLNDVKYFEKPPLQYWMTALAYQAFGLNEFAARFWTGLTGAAGIVLAGFSGMRLFGRSAGIMAAIINASSLLYLVIGHLNILDMSLSFFLQLTVCSFLLAQRSAPASGCERNWMLLAWASAALAFLSKGLIALLLPSLTLLVYTALTREYSAWKRLHICKGLAVFLLLALPWLVAVTRVNPEFPQFFFLHEQFERYLNNNHDRDGPWWYFLPLFALGTLPWTFIAFGQIRASWRSESAANGLQSRRFLMSWIVVVIGFFSLSHSKLPPYILPAIPMFALLLGDMLARMSNEKVRGHLAVMGSVLLILGLAVACLPDTIGGAKAVQTVHDARPFALIGLLLMATTLLGVRWVRHRKPVVTIVLASGLGVLLGVSVVLQGTNVLSKARSGYELAKHITPALTATTRLFSVGDYNQTLPFHLQRHMTLVNYRGELDFGLTQEPHLAIDSLEAFARTWRNQKDAIAVVTPELYDELLNQGLPMQFLDRQDKLVAVRKSN